MFFSESAIKQIIRSSINPRLRISKAAIIQLNEILHEEGAAILKIASEIAGYQQRKTLNVNDIWDAYSALFL